MLRRSFSSFHYITIIGLTSWIKGLVGSRNVVNVAFHFATLSLNVEHSGLLALYFNFAFVTAKQKNKFIHAKNLPNRINIFLFANLFSGGRREQ